MLGLPQIKSENVQRLDSVDFLEELSQVGRAVAGRSRWNTLADLSGGEAALPELLGRGPFGKDAGILFAEDRLRRSPRPFATWSPIPNRTCASPWRTLVRLRGR